MLETQVSDGAEHHREYVRLKQPALVEINKVFYDTIDWSDDGVALEWNGQGTLEEDVVIGRLYNARMIFCFGDCQIGIPVTLAARYVNAALDRAGFQYAELRIDQAKFIKTLVEKYSSGEEILLAELMEFSVS
jgi:hypothetical protein